MQKTTNDPLPFCFCLSSLVSVLVAPPRRVARYSLRLYYIYFGPPSPFALMAQTEQNHWINKSLAEEWPTRERRRGPGWKWQVFRADSGSICQQFEGIVYLGRKQRLHDRWRGENLPASLAQNAGKHEEIAFS